MNDIFQYLKFEFLMDIRFRKSIKRRQQHQGCNVISWRKNLSYVAKCLPLFVERQGHKVLRHRDIKDYHLRVKQITPASATFNSKIVFQYYKGVNQYTLEYQLKINKLGTYVSWCLNENRMWKCQQDLLWL